MPRAFALALACAAFAPSCIFNQVVGESEATPQPARAKQSLVVLVQAQPRYQSNLPSGPGWYPAELAIEDERLKVLFDRREDDEEPRQAYLQGLSYRLLQTFGAGQHPVAELKRFNSLEDYLAWRDRPRSNVIEVRLIGVEEQVGLSMLGSCVTLLVLPGAIDQRLRTETIHYNDGGRLQRVPTPPDPLLRRWFGWVFFLWGPIASDSESDLTIETLKHRVQDASYEFR